MTAQQARVHVGGSWEERKDGWWLHVEPEEVQQVARKMLEAGARFATILGVPGPGEEYRVSWHWDIDGVLLSVRARIAVGALVPSIFDIYPGADWAERELCDYFAVEFKGRATTPPLMLREEDRRGVLLCKTGEKL